MLSLMNSPSFSGAMPLSDVRIEDFQEVPEFFPLRLLAKFLVPQQRFAVLLQVVDERDRVETEIRAGKLAAVAVALNLAALNLVNARRAERLRRFARVATVAHRPNIRGVIRARGGRDVGVLEQPFLDGELLVHVGGHQHDVHQPLMRDLANDVEKLGQVAIAELVARPDLRRELRRPRAALARDSRAAPARARQTPCPHPSRPR